MVALKSSIDKFTAADVSNLSIEQRNKINQKLMAAEQALTATEGLPRRPWYKHQIYAPGFYTGYGVKTLPGVREAVEQKDWKEAQEQIVVLTETLKRFNAHLLEINKLL
jgi:N-acetylated-alpha-linked acidic dipeptidase